MPYEIVYGQKPNRLSALGVETDGINLEDVGEILEEKLNNSRNSPLPENEIEPANFSIHGVASTKTVPFLLLFIIVFI